MEKYYLFQPADIEMSKRYRTHMVFDPNSSRINFKQKSL